MLLPVPVPTLDPGPDWAYQIYACLYSQIDAHDHSSGKGVLITPQGLNINTDLSFQGNSASNLTATKYNSQSSALSGVTFPASVYVNGEDLWYNTLSGTQIRLTAGGLVNATSSGISSGTASASFVSGVLVVNAAPLTPANIQVASVLLGNNVASSNYLTLSPPNAMGASYGLVLPALPGSLSFMTLDTSGNMGTASSVSGSQIAAGSITGSQIASSTIATANLQNNSVTAAKLFAFNSNTTSGSGTFSTASSSPVLVYSNISLTVSGLRPIVISFVPDGTLSPALIAVTAPGATITSIGSIYEVLMDGNVVGISELFTEPQGTPPTIDISIPPGCLNLVLPPPSTGSHTFNLQIKVDTAGATAYIFHTKMFVYEG